MTRSIVSDTSASAPPSTPFTMSKEGSVPEDEKKNEKKKKFITYVSVLLVRSAEALFKEVNKGDAVDLPPYRLVGVPNEPDSFQCDLAIQLNKTNERKNEAVAGAAAEDTIVGRSISSFDIATMLWERFEEIIGEELKTHELEPYELVIREIEESGLIYLDLITTKRETCVIDVSVLLARSAEVLFKEVNKGDGVNLLPYRLVGVPNEPDSFQCDLAIKLNTILMTSPNTGKVEKGKKEKARMDKAKAKAAEKKIKVKKAKDKAEGRGRGHYQLAT
jgi:hypothetical protein